MGNQLLGSEKMKSPSFRIHESKLDEFDAHIDAHDEWSSRSEAVRKLIDEELDATNFDADEDEYLPSDDGERSVYLAMLGAANANLIYSPRRHGNALKRQLGESDLEAAAFVPLRRKGFIARQDSPPMKRSNARPAHVYRVKPRCADPEQWKYREVVVTDGGRSE
jgi:Arc/MetJ-type ribon-helix-helix transcriptional regulator